MLEKIGDLSLVQLVYSNVVKTGYFKRVIVATDHNEIKHQIELLGGTAILTPSDLPSGTDRALYALNKLDDEYDFVINVQGDEALISGVQLGPLVRLLNSEKQIDIATLCTKNKSLEDFENPNCVKLVKTNEGKVIYFSRAQIPYPREGNFDSFLQHIGVYAFSKRVVQQIKNLPESKVEKTEKLEQLRWMEAGFDIYVSEVKGKLIGVDTKEDLKLVRSLLA